MSYGEILTVSHQIIINQIILRKKVNSLTMQIRILLSFFIINIHSASSQSTLQIFSSEDFTAQISKYHPIAKQADIIVDKAKAELLNSRGNFDPIVEFDANKKTFDGKNYYYYLNQEIKFPTRAGFDIKTGIENNSGDYLNSEITNGQSSYLGIEVPLGKGLLIDKRRATLRQAKIFREQSEQERLSIINDLLFDAYNDYYQWVGAYQLFKVYSKYVDNANIRLRLVKISLENGDRSIADTVEAFAQVQNYLLHQSDALLKLNNAKFDLCNHLWSYNNKPYQLPSYFLPDTIKFLMISPLETPENIIEASKNQNPLLRSYDFKLKSLNVEKKLKFQGLLPSFNLQANLLSKNYYQPSNFNGAYLQNNYKWGINFKVPLFLRQARGDYANAQLKIKETSLELIRKQWQVENKIRSYYNENTLIQQQLVKVQNIYQNYFYLLRNEELKFKQGESSLFLINTREMKVLDILQKELELRVKYFKSKYAIEWAAGLLRF